MKEYQREALESFSHFELAELILMTMSGTSEQLTLFLTGLFAYFTIAYMIGKKLSIFQLYSITFVYTAFSMVAILGFMSLHRRLDMLLVFRDGESPIPWVVPPTVCVIGWVLSIVFMAHSRKQVDT